MPAAQEEQPASRYARLPDPIRPEDLRTSTDVVSHPDDGSDDLRERAWLIRTAGIV